MKRLKINDVFFQPNNQDIKFDYIIKDLNMIKCILKNKVLFQFEITDNNIGLYKCYDENNNETSFDNMDVIKTDINVVSYQLGNEFTNSLLRIFITNSNKKMDEIDNVLLNQNNSINNILEEINGIKSNDILDIDISRIENMENSISNINNNIETLNNDFNNIKNNITTINNNIEGLQSEYSDVTADIYVINQKLNEINNKINIYHPN